jgi:hypothetical protein
LGDSDFHPFDRAALADVLARHGGPVEAVWRIVDGLADSPAVAETLGELADLEDR